MESNLLINIDLLKIEKITKALESEKIDLDPLALLVYSEKLEMLETEGKDLMEEISGTHKNIQHLHKILAKINEETDEDGKLKPSEELKELYNQAEEMGLSVDRSLLEKEKLDFNQKERLVENIKMSIEDLNMENDTKLQKVNHLNNERFSVIQFIRKVLDSLHQTKQMVIRNIQRATS